MNSYKLTYKINGIECPIIINADNKESAINTIKDIIPSATNITLI